MGAAHWRTPARLITQSGATLGEAVAQTESATPMRHHKGCSNQSRQPIEMNPGTVGQVHTEPDA